jgi:hypothetical protein
MIRDTIGTTVTTQSCIPVTPPRFKERRDLKGKQARYSTVKCIVSRLQKTNKKAPRNKPMSFPNSIVN